MPELECLVGPLTAATFTVLLLLHVDEPELDSSDLGFTTLLTVNVDLGLGLGVRVVGFGAAGAGVEGAVAIGVGFLDATTVLGFLAFLVLIFSSSSEEG